jgi:hypothetical protein
VIVIRSLESLADSEHTINNNGVDAFVSLQLHTWLTYAYVRCINRCAYQDIFRVVVQYSVAHTNKTAFFDYFD